jgi:protein-disulfide isomerase-like protein with CxxC motif
MKIATANDFRLSSEMGVKGFPSVILKTDKGQFYMVSNGYTTCEKLLSTIKKAVQKQD